MTPSTLWGDEDHVRGLFAAHDVTLRFERPTFPAMFESVEAFESFIFKNSGGMIAARSALKELGRWDEAHAAMRDALEKTNEADDASYRATWDFLLIVGTNKT